MEAEKCTFPHTCIFVCGDRVSACRERIPHADIVSPHAGSHSACGGRVSACGERVPHAEIVSLYAGKQLRMRESNSVCGKTTQHAENTFRV